MNHYERLKVSQDAPPEVIRAAYRALAAKLHPDRQGGTMGVDDAMHEQMVALNGAYEVLIDPKLRQDYDASLAPSRPLFGAPPVAGEAPLHPGAGSARVDMDWAVPLSAAPKPAWPPSRRTVYIGAGVAGLVVLAGAAWVLQIVGQHQIEEALSDQYMAAPDTRAPTPTLPKPPVARMAAAHPLPGEAEALRATGKPSVAELARMSDEELLEVLPTLDEANANARPKRATGSAGAARATGTPARHPLDGSPLPLRTEEHLVDPLAPEPAPAKR